MWKTTDIPLTHEMLSIIAEIDHFRGSWELLGRLAPERLSSLRHVATIESVGSSTRIEGASLSNIQIERILSKTKEGSFSSRDEQEVAGYALVTEEVFSSYLHMPLSENLIKQLHIYLLKYSEKDQRHQGNYKKILNNIEAFNDQGKSLGVIFETASPFDTPRKMEELVYWASSQLALKEIHPLIVIAIFVVSFLAIHPFQDGNGRLSRVLTNLLLLKEGYNYVPYSSLESIIEKNKEQYYLALRKTQGTLNFDHPDFHPWILFFLRSLLRQKNNLAVKVERERKFLMGYNRLSGSILTIISENGRVAVRDLEAATEANRSTIKRELQKLVSMGMITKNGRGRGTNYSLGS